MLIKNVLIQGNTYRILDIFYDQYYGNPNQNWPNGIKPFVYADLLDCSNQNTLTVYASTQMTKGLIPYYSYLLTNTIDKESLDLKRVLFFKYNGQDSTTKKYEFYVSSTPTFVEPLVNNDVGAEITIYDKNDSMEIKK